MEEKKALQQEEERETWGNKLDFVMSALSFAVGMGNMWRFPYLCYRSGGGAFLIPYLVTMLFCGYPLMFLEFALGQYAKKGIVSVWKACPLFEGIGWGMMCVSIFTAIYYNMIVAWCFFYLFASLSSDVPWRDCGHSWNSPGCANLETTLMVANCSRWNGTWFNDTCLTTYDVTSDVTYADIVNASQLLKRTSASEEFFHKYMLDISEGFHDLGEVRWPLALCLLLCWTIVVLCLARGIKVSGKVTYITACFPYVVLVILLVRGLTLDGAMEGIKFYVTPDWTKLLSARVWGDAAVQAFFSLSLCWGGLITLASYNKFHNNCLRDSIVVATGDMLTSIFSGFVIFAVIGFMAHELNIPVNKVAAQGPGLAFIVYPEVTTKLPVSPLWSALFMIMLINVGMGSQITLVSTIHATFLDVFPRLFKPKGRSTALLLVICVLGFLMGLVFTTKGGLYVLLLMDSYAATYALLGLAFFECIAIGWVYGTNRFYDDIEQMLGWRPGPLWLTCWKLVTPSIIVFIMLFVFSDFKRSSYNDYIFPLEWDILGWIISMFSILIVPLVGLIKVCTADRQLTILQRLRHLSKSTIDWPSGYDVKKQQETESTIEMRVRLSTDRIHECDV